MISVPFHTNLTCIVLPSVLFSHPPPMKCPHCKANVTTKPPGAGLAPNPQPYPGTNSPPLLLSTAQMFNTGCSSMLGTGTSIMHIHGGLLGHLLGSQATDVTVPVLSRNILQPHHQITQSPQKPALYRLHQGTGSKTTNINIHPNGHSTATATVHCI